jgi:MFS family permease
MEANNLVIRLDADEPVTWRKKFIGIIQRAPNVSNANLIVYYWASFVVISLYVYINANQKYVLDKFVGVPKEEQGRVSGDLAFANEIVIIACAYGFGSLSDILGSRKIVYVFSFVFMAIGLGIYPLATSVTVLIVFRVIYAIGAAGSSAMLTAVLGDYTSERDRGKATGLLGVMSGLGAIAASLLFLRFPQWFVAAGLTEHQAGYLSYALVALYSLITAIVVVIGLKGLLINIRRREETDEEKKSVFTILKEGIIAAKDPMILLSYAAGFVARGDSVLITTFITLWVGQVMKEHGASDPDAIARAGLVSGIAQTFALVAAPFVGFLADKVNRVGTLIVVSLISGIGYTSIYFVPDVTTGIVYLPIALIGIGEIGVIISSQILVTTSAPKSALGGVSGIFSICGGVGILIATKIGGIIYDHWTPGGVFVLMGAFNFVLCILAIVVLLVKAIMDRKAKKSELRQLVDESYDDEATE